MEPRFIVVDEYGESLRAFHNQETAEAFVKIRPECSIEEVKPMSLEEFAALYGEPPF